MPRIRRSVHGISCLCYVIRVVLLPPVVILVILLVLIVVRRTSGSRNGSDNDGLFPTQVESEGRAGMSKHAAKWNSKCLLLQTATARRNFARFQLDCSVLLKTFPRALSLFGCESNSSRNILRYVDNLKLIRNLYCATRRCRDLYLNAYAFSFSRRDFLIVCKKTI